MLPSMSTAIRFESYLGMEDPLGFVFDLRFLGRCLNHDTNLFTHQGHSCLDVVMNLVDLLSYLCRPYMIDLGTRLYSDFDLVQVLGDLGFTRLFKFSRIFDMANSDLDSDKNMK